LLILISQIKSMDILTPSNWTDYELLDSGNGKRLERFGKYILVRPDPQILWKPKLHPTEWDKVDAVFERSSEDKGNWDIKTEIPEKWEMDYKNLKFYAKLTPFKHTGVFPEQSVQWDFIQNVILNAVKNLKDPSVSPQDDNKRPRILNLFAYTGIATLAAAEAGAKVTHVDASKSTIAWARENQTLSGLEDKPIRWILDDTLKFVEREVRRNAKYDGIIMDPPAFGHGPTGGMWKFNDNFPQLLNACKQLLSDQPLFILINAYAISSSSLMLENVLQDLNLNGRIEVGELALKEKESNRLLSTGIFGRWYH